MKEKYQLLLNKTYELEGLILLALSKDPLPRNIEELINQKRRDIAALQLHPKSKTQEPSRDKEGNKPAFRKLPTIDEPAAPKQPLGAESIAPKETAVTFVHKEKPKLQSESPIETTVKEAQEESQIEKPEPQKEPVATILPKEEPVMKRETAEKHETPEEKKEPAKKAEPEEPFFYNLEEDDDEYTVPKTFRPKKKTFNQEGKRKRPVFSLNDRFLFIRELFEGDAAVFNRALDLVVRAENFQEAEDILINEFVIDPESETDARFLDIIRAAFVSR